MRIKQRPEDFSVKESYRFDEVPTGRHRVYLMDKQKLSTFDAIDRIRERFGLKPGAISYCGLKDKQGRTEQLIAVDNADVELQEPDLRLKFLGRTERALSAANTTSNRFSVTVRALTEDDLPPLTLAAAEVSRLGVVNYFDSQRFGSLKHGQGFIAKDLIRGDFEAALKNYLAKPSPLDRSEDAKVKEFWRSNWGDWNLRAPFESNKKYFRILNVLREDPKDFVRAFLQIDSAYRALLLFTYQSYLWNEGVRRYLQLLLPREHMFPMQYQAGTLLFHRDADRGTLEKLRRATFPLLAPDSKIHDPKVKEAVDWVLGKEKLKLQELRIEEAAQLLFFKHEERALLAEPHKLVVGRTMRDEVNRNEFLKVNVAFTLPPGSYATLVIKRLFHFNYREDTDEEIRSMRRKIDGPREEETDSAESDSREGAGARHSKDQRGAGLRNSQRGEASSAGRNAQRGAEGREDRPGRSGARGEAVREDRSARPGNRGETDRGERRAVSGASSSRERPVRTNAATGPSSREEPSPVAPRGFRAQQREKKETRQKNRNQAKFDPKSSGRRR
ncbi:MAG: tRNA pseudouridine(13) synthase TruD [Myxococcaceae bacterium]